MSEGTRLCERYLRESELPAAKQAMKDAGVDENDGNAVWRFLETYPTRKTTTKETE
jgi:hypothetical protein